MKQKMDHSNRDRNTVKYDMNRKIAPKVLNNRFNLHKKAFK